MVDRVYYIHTFDDGNQKYSCYPNNWIILESMFGGGKVKLQNFIRKEIFISSISKWKII